MTPAAILEHYTADLLAGKSFLQDETREVFTALQAPDLEESLIAGLLTAWNKKGAATDEVFALASTMRQRAARVEHSVETFIDMAGTGGSKRKTFNVSTAAAFVIAGAGLPVAKHGNRAATSGSGSADVAAELGINILADPDKAAQCLSEIGICFMFAPAYHSLSPILGKVRRSLGFPTIFNMVGPLCNPADAPHQVMGVWDAEVLKIVPDVMARLGTKRSWVVNGSGLDEVTLDGATEVVEVSGDSVRPRTVAPEDFGLETSEISHFAKVSPQTSADLVKDILSSKCSDRCTVDMVLINAAAALYVAGAASGLIEASRLARNSIDSGAALDKLQLLKEATN